MTDTITEDEMAACEELFHLFDKNSDGRISFDEYKNAVLIYNQNVCAEYIKDSFDEYATGGSIGFDSFVKAITNSNEGWGFTEKEIQAAFKVFDVNDDGGISIQDYYATMSRLDSNLTMEITEETFRELGLGVEDIIDYELFKIIVSD